MMILHLHWCGIFYVGSLFCRVVLSPLSSSVNDLPQYCHGFQCSVSLPHSVVGWFMVCGIALSYSLTVCACPISISV